MAGFSLNWFLGILTVELWVMAYALTFLPEISRWFVTVLFGRRARRGGHMQRMAYPARFS